MASKIILTLDYAQATTLSTLLTLARADQALKATALDFHDLAREGHWALRESIIEIRASLDNAQHI